MRGWLVYEPGFSLDKQKGLWKAMPYVFPSRRLARNTAESLSLMRMILHRVVQVWLSDYKCKRYGYLVYNTKFKLTQQPAMPRVYPTKLLALQMADHFDKIYAGKHKVVRVHVYYD